MTKIEARRGKRLFICGTPLQSLIVDRIMDRQDADNENCGLFFYSYSGNEKYRYYFKKLSERCGKSMLYVSDFRYPGYILSAKKALREFEFDTIYLGSVTSVFSLIALSLQKHRSLFTFDDGSANVRPGSIYASKYGLSPKKYLALKLLGNKYSLRRIRQETQGHYTVYPGFKNNITDKLIEISIVEKGQAPPDAGRCSVILGTVFREAFGAKYVEHVRNRLARFIETLGENVFFIPHPRERQDEWPNCQTVDAPRIAEEVITELAMKYRHIDLYGFGSTTQLIMLENERMSNTFLTLGAPGEAARETYELAKSAGMKSVQVLDLESYR